VYAALNPVVIAVLNQVTEGYYGSYEIDIFTQEALPAA
jgi:hypothetical protein